MAQSATDTAIPSRFAVRRPISSSVAISSKNALHVGSNGTTPRAQGCLLKPRQIKKSNCNQQGTARYRLSRKSGRSRNCGHETFQYDHGPCRFGRSATSVQVAGHSWSSPASAGPTFCGRWRAHPTLLCLSGSYRSGRVVVHHAALSAGRSFSGRDSSSAALSLRCEILPWPAPGINPLLLHYKPQVEGNHSNLVDRLQHR